MTNLIDNLTSSAGGGSNEETGLLKVVSDYKYALDLFDQYDHGNLGNEGITTQEVFRLNYDLAVSLIREVKGIFPESKLFGNEKDESLRSSLAAIYQTFADQDLYPSVQEKAANLLYFVTKNHSFSDGNKRIASCLFLLFMARNGALYRPDGSKRIGDNALVAFVLLIAESKPDEKDLLIRLLINLINLKN